MGDKKSGIFGVPLYGSQLDKPISEQASENNHFARTVGVLNLLGINYDGIKQIENFPSLSEPLDKLASLTKND